MLPQCSVLPFAGWWHERGKCAIFRDGNCCWSRRPHRNSAAPPPLGRRGSRSWNTSLALIVRLWSPPQSCYRSLPEGSHEPTRNRPPEVPVKSGSVTLVNLFQVPPGESEQFLERWKDNARVMIGQPGFIRLRLLRSLIDDAEMRYINVAEWASGADLERGYANPRVASVRATLAQRPGPPRNRPTARLRGRL